MASQALSQAYQAPIDIINKLNAENALAKKEAKQEARQAELDAQNKQLFDLKMSEFDRENKDRESLINFNKKMLEPQVISGIISDSISASQVDKMSFTPEELAEYNLAKGDLSKLTGSTKSKAEMQMALSDFSDKVSVSPEYQETGYQQAQRIASGMELTPSILEELKKYQIADVTAEKERKKDMATYSAEAKELETKIAELRTKQSAIQDKAAGVGKEWGKKGTSSGGSEVLDSAKMLKYADMVKDTDSADELQGMIKEVFVNPNIPEKQKEAIAANIVLSSGAKLPQGLIDFGKLNVSVEDAQKATEEYLTGLKTDKFTPNTPKEIGGINDEIALLEARRNTALAKANAYSLDRTEAAKLAISSKIDELLGKTITPTSNNGDKDVYHGNEAIKIVESKEGPLTDEMKYVIGNEGFINKAYVDKAGNKEVETIGVGQTGDYKNKTFKETYEDRLNILKKQVPNLDSLPLEVRKTLIDNHYRGEIGTNTLKLINEGKYAEAGEAFLKGRKDYNEDTPQQIKNRMDALSNALKSVPKESNIKDEFAKVDTTKVDKNPLAKMSDSDLKEAISLLDPIKDKYVYIDMANELKNRNADKAKDSIITYKGEAVTGGTIRDAIDKFDKYVKSRTYNEDGTINNLGTAGLVTETGLSLSPLTALSRFGVKEGVKGTVEKVIPEVVPTAQKLLGYNKVPQLTRTPEVIIPPVKPRVINEIPISEAVLNAKNANEAARNIAPKLESYQKLSETFRADPALNNVISNASKRGVLSNSDKTEIVNILNSYSDNGLNVISELSRMQLPAKIEKEIMQMLTRGLN